jgi:hypothetical protein
MHKKLVLLTAMIFAFGVVFASCAGMQVKPTAANFKSPTVTLGSFEVPEYDGYWYYSGKVKPTKGDAGDRGAFLPMSFLFDVQNPNDYPVLLDGITFTVAFDNDFQLVTLNNTDSHWIPAGKTNQIRMDTMITVRSALLNLLVTSGFKLKERGWSPWDALERWWQGVPDYSVPVKVTEGAFTFKADGLVKVVPFEGAVK